MIERRTGAVAVALLSIAAAPAGSDEDPTGYRLRVPLSVEAGARVQRLVLSATVLAALQTRDGHDVRVFDARGRAMPIARGNASAAVSRVSLVPMPILGAREALKVSGISLRLDGNGAAQVAEVRGEPIGSGGAPVLLGVLLDARRIVGRADRLFVAADLPVGQPVTLIVEASTDLRDWQRVGETTVYRRPNDTTWTRAVPLNGAGIKRHYLKITWTANARLLTPVAIRNAMLDTRPDTVAAAVTLDARAPAAAADPHIVDFALPFATPITSLRVIPAEHNGVIPVRILGRDDREQPWDLLGRGLATGDGTREIGLTGDTPHTVRIEADARSSGFTAAPRLQIGFPERSVIFLTTGTAPFALSIGRQYAKDSYLAQADLTEGQGRIGTARSASTPNFLPTLLLSTADTRSTRSQLLWIVLLAATALLAGIAWLIWRQDRVARTSAG